MTQPSYEEQILDALLRTRRGDGSVTRWQHAQPYLLRHAIEHAEAAHRSDDLIADPEFLVYAHPDSLAPALDEATSPAARLFANIYSESIRLHQESDPEQRRELLMIDAARHNSPSTADAFATQVRGYWRRWRCRWATGSQTNPSFRHELQPVQGRVLSQQQEVDRPLNFLGIGRIGSRAVLITGGHGAPVMRWDPDTGHQIGTPITGPTRSVVALAITLDGTWLATASANGTVRIWDTATGTTRATLVGHTATVNGVAIAPDGTWLATASADGTARVWDTATGTTRATLTGHLRRIDAMAIAPDGTWLATASADTVRIWDTATGTTRATLTGHTATVNAVAIAPDGTWLATASADGTARIWDTATGSHRATLTGHTAAVNAVAIAPDGDLARHRQRRRHGADLGRRHRHHPGHPHRPHRRRQRGGRSHPTATWLATASGDGTVRIWDAATGTTGPPSPATPRRERGGDRTRRRPGSPPPAPTAPRGSGTPPPAPPGHPHRPHRRRERGGDRTRRDLARHRQRRRHRADLGRRHRHHRATLTGHTATVNAVAIAPDGTWLATASADGTARIWDAATGTTGHPHRPHQAGQSVASRPTAPGSPPPATTAPVRIWDAATGTTRATLTGHTATVNAVAIAPDGTWLATASRDGTARIWDTATGTSRATLVGHFHWVDDVTIAPDGRWLATAGGDGAVHTWDTTGRSRAALLGHTGSAKAVAISPDGIWLATASADGTVRAWDTATGAPRRGSPFQPSQERSQHCLTARSWSVLGGKFSSSRSSLQRRGCEQYRRRSRHQKLPSRPSSPVRRRASRQDVEIRPGGGAAR